MAQTDRKKVILGWTQGTANERKSIRRRWHRDWWGMGKGKESACNAGGSGLGWKELGGVLVRKDAKPMWVWRGGWTNTCANQIALSQSTEEDTDISMISKECLDWEVFWFVWSSTSLNADRDSCFLNASISPNSWKLWIHKTLSVMDSFVYILWDHRKNWTMQGIINPLWVRIRRYKTVGVNLL